MLAVCTASMTGRPRFSSSTMSMRWSQCWRAWRQSGERDIGRSATQLSRPILQQNELDARENRNVAIIAFVEIGHPALLPKGSSISSGDMGCR